MIHIKDLRKVAPRERHRIVEQIIQQVRLSGKNVENYIKRKVKE